MYGAHRLCLLSGYRIPFLELIHKGLVQSSFMDDVFRYQKKN